MRLLRDCNKFDPTTFSFTTTWYLLGWDVKLSGSLCTLFLTALGVKKHVLKRRIFNLSPNLMLPY